MPIDLSKFFDSIRIKPNKLSAKQQAAAREASAMCEWPDCKNKGPHRAPKGRANDKEYWHFCLNHVREYNQSYNFFSGMNADAVARYQKDALTGHRPTWKMGANTSAKKGKGSPEADLEARVRPVQHVQRTQRPRPLAAGSGRRRRRGQGRDPRRSSTPSARRCR